MSELTELKFSKDWTNPEDFATYEPDEAKVRGDLQFLFNEIRDWINKILLPALTSGGVEKLDVIYSDTKPAGPALWIVDHGFENDADNLDPATLKYVDEDGVEFKIYPGTRAEYEQPGEDSESGASAGGGSRLWFVPDVDSVGALYDYLLFSNLVGYEEANETTVSPGDMLLCKDGGILFVDKINQIGDNYYVVNKPKAGSFDPADGAVLELGSGTAPNVEIGTVETGDAGTAASASIEEHIIDGETVYKLNLTLPRGADGGKGAKGDPGADGATPVLRIGTVETLEPGSKATASVTLVEGYSNVYDVNFGLPRGATGATGATGADGEKGEPGASATVEIGEVLTLAAGSQATATLSLKPGSENSYVLALGIPQGIQGNTGEAGDSGLPAKLEIGAVTAVPPGNGATASLALKDAGTNTYSLNLGLPTGATGAQGEKGDPGATPVFTIGTVKTLEADAEATASITGTVEAPVLNLGIPKGADGAGDSGAVVTIGTYDGGFDVVCQGTGNDNTYLKQAIDMLPENGGTIRMSNGTYDFSNPVEITKNNVRIIGYNGMTSRGATDDGSTLINCTGGAFIHSGEGLELHGLTIVGSTGYAVSSTGNGNVKIINCSIEGFSTALYGLNFLFGDDTSVCGCSFKDCSIGINGAKKAKIVDNVFINCGTAIFNPNGGCNISGNAIFDCDIGISIAASNDNTIVGNTIKRGDGTAADYTDNQHTIRFGSSSLIDWDTSVAVYGMRNYIVNNQLHGKDVTIDYRDITEDAAEANLATNVIRDNWASAMGVASDIPTFDLAAMGLPAVVLSGEISEVSLEDNTAVLKAMYKGAVKFLFKANIGMEVTVAATVCPNTIMEMDGWAANTIMIYDGTPLLVCIEATLTTIRAKVRTLSSQ